MSKRNQWIGRAGEKRFQTLCTDVGVTCNKSVEDDYGWDMMIEFPPELQLDIPIDMRTAQLAATVQVKATMGRRLACTISLDNALRMAKSSLPSFLFLMVLHKDRVPRYYIRHVWQPLICEWLKAGREADARGETRTHKVRIPVKFSAGDEQIDQPIAWIGSQIRNIAPDYASAKAEIVRSVGFEKGGGFASITIDAVTPDDFLDLQLGLREHIMASRFQFTSERFGIRARKPDIDVQNVRLLLTPEGRDGILCLEFPAGLRLAVPATLIGAAVAAPETDLFGWRIKSRCFDLIFRPDGRISARATTSIDAKMPLCEIAIFAQLQATPAGEAIRIEMDLDGKNIDLGTLALDAREAPDGWAQLALAATVLQSIADASARPAPETSVGVLNSAFEELEVLSALASERTMMTEFLPEKGVPRRFQWLLAYAQAAVGDTYYAAVVRRPITGDVRRGKRRRITFGTAKLLYTSVGPTTAACHDTLRKAYERQLARLSKEGDILALGDIQAIVAKGPGDHVLVSDLPDDGA